MLCVFAPKPSSVPQHHQIGEAKGYLSTCNVHFCLEPRESWILHCCQHLGLAQMCHLAEVSLL